MLDTQNSEITFSIRHLCFDENYQPSNNSRTTTNFANLARGKKRQQNLRCALTMINNRFNALVSWDNPQSNRYSVELEIVSVDVNIKGEKESFPCIEMLQTRVLDKQTNTYQEGIVGNNFSSFIRDYDFSVVLIEHNKAQSKFSVPNNFGDLHGKMYQHFINSSVYTSNFSKPPVICLSVSDKKVYRRIENIHPLLGAEYLPESTSLTENYFNKMGLKVRYFMPPNSVAPLAFYFVGDLLNDYTNIELASTISTMETFQKIYRPEIYNANARAGRRYRPSLHAEDHSLTRVTYDRKERSQLAIEQGRFAEENFVKPHKAFLDNWSANFTI